MNLYIDIETCPGQKEGFRDAIEVKPPGNIKKPESIQKWMDEKGDSAIEEQYRKTALSGTFGEILCISWALDDEEPELVGRELDGDEGDLLSQFFERLTDQLEERQQDNRPIPTLNWIGHNISGFDLRFIFQRCVVNQVKPSVPLPYDAKPWEIQDTMIMWAGLHGSDKSLDKVCQALGIEGKGDMDGSKVYQAALAGEYDKIFDYCIDDVNKTRQIFKRLTFA